MEGTEGFGITLGQFREYIKELPDETVLVEIGLSVVRESLSGGGK